MEKYYSDEKNVQVLIALLKEHRIRKIIISPGSANSSLSASLQRDDFFEMYSSVDERSAAYMACGLAEEAGEPVVISCTGATASRNYLPGLTEAYYRKLPIIAITSTQETSRIGHHHAQLIDRRNLPNDVANLSVLLQTIKRDEDFWDCEIKINKVILELKRHGGGPVHINLTTGENRTFNTKELPKVRKIERITLNNIFPELHHGKIAVIIGSHTTMTQKQTETIDRFCASNNAVVFCDHTSSYKGEYRVLYALAASQQAFDISSIRPDLLIHIGQISGDYYSLKISGKQVWRVSEDGEIRDRFKKLTHVFEMQEQKFFENYINTSLNKTSDYFDACKNHLKTLYSKLPELPFSNIWIASQMARKIPDGSTVHLGILNSLRSWNFFEFPNSVTSFSNVGGFGIDGNVSAIVGASLMNKDKLYFGVIGDLAFFYDMNVLGNRHAGKNLRILLVNNGRGTEFRQFNHEAAQHGDDADDFIAAAGHFGNKSKTLVKHYTQDLGFEYLSAGTKDEFKKIYERFLCPKITDKPILFEVFTNSEDESEALKKIMNLEADVNGKVKNIAKQVLGTKGIKTIKKVIGR